LLDMPPLQFADLPGLRMSYYEAGPKDDPVPMVLLHGWPELAFSWRHQIKAFAAAGRRVIAPDQRGFGATPGPEDRALYDLDHLTADIVHLLDHLKIERAIVVGHDWGGAVAWGFPMRYPDRTAGVIGLNTPHAARAPVDPIAIYRKRFGDSMYIVQFQDSQAPDGVFASRVEATFDALMRKPSTRPAGPTNLDLVSLVRDYDPARDHRAPILDADERAVFIDAFRRSGFTGGINWYRNITRNWERAASLDYTLRMPCLMITAEQDAVLPPSASQGMEALIPDLERHNVMDSGHWTQQEQAQEVNRVILDWRRRRFG
jgi:pimeloyl-ACP methyl ester carboxylesterase